MTKSKTNNCPDYRIDIELLEKELIQEIHNIILTIINTKSMPRPVIRPNSKLTYRLQIRNKSPHHFLTATLNISTGKKSDKVIIPDLIKKSNDQTKISFLARLFDTDKVLRGNGIGFCSGSKRLIYETIDLLNELNIKNSNDV